MGKYQEYVLGAVCFLAAAVSLAAAAAICFFLFAGAVPFLQEEGIISFLGGRDWQPTEGVFGIFPMLVGSAYVTGGAVLLGVPPGLLCGTFLSGAGVPDCKAFGRNHGGDTLGGLRTVRHQLSCTVGAAILRRQRQGNSQRGCDAGDHDFADCHQRGRERDPGCTGKLLRGCAGSGREQGAECLFCAAAGGCARHAGGGHAEDRAGGRGNDGCGHGSRESDLDTAVRHRRCANLDRADRIRNGLRCGGKASGCADQRRCGAFCVDLADESGSYAAAGTVQPRKAARKQQK